MSYRVRPARAEDFAAIYEMAKLTGGGFTNLPADKPTIRDKLRRSAEAFARAEERPFPDLYLFVLEDPAKGPPRGTCQIFGAVGMDRPFTSYRIATVTQHSPELGRTFANDTLSLTTDLAGASEVGGLFLHPRVRAGGLGMLLARSRYLFIRAHRARFGDTVQAELRGVIDENGNSPFWDAIAGRFLGMSFPDADAFNAVHGTQTIAALMPSAPIYTAMLPEAARAAIGQPHASGRAAQRMLQDEGFAHQHHVDIFDGGPTMTVATDAIRTIRTARDCRVGRIADDGSEAVIAAAGRLTGFRACCARIATNGEEATIDPAAAAMLEVSVGDAFSAVSR